MPKLLDLFCGAGGCSAGYSLAGFTVTGVDNVKQPRYPRARYGLRFRLADALEYLEKHGHEYDVIHASPPCQRFSRASVQLRNKGIDFPNLIPQVRELLIATGKPYVIENVIGAPLLSPMMLCGQMFGLKVLRHRLFETNFPTWSPWHTPHAGLRRGVDFIVPVVNANDATFYRDYFAHMWRSAMQTSWMTRVEISQAIPPKYTEFIGKQLQGQLVAA